MVVAVGWGTYLNAAQDDLKKCFWKNIHFRKVVFYCGVNRMIIFPKHPFSQVSILLFILATTFAFASVRFLLSGPLYKNAELAWA